MGPIWVPFGVPVIWAHWADLGPTFYLFGAHWAHLGPILFGAHLGPILALAAIPVWGGYWYGYWQRVGLLRYTKMLVQSLEG